MISNTRVADISAQLARTFALTTAGALALALCSQVAFYHAFSPVPTNLGVLGVLLLGGVLGARLGTLAVLEFLLLGACGAPVFAGFHGSILWLLGPTGGFLLGYLPAVAIFGMICERFAVGSYARRVVVSFFGALPTVAIIYLGGWAWLAFGWHLGTENALLAGILPFIIIDTLKAGFAASILSVINKREF